MQAKRDLGSEKVHRVATHSLCIVLAVVHKNYTLLRGFGGMMEKFKHILYFTFILMPLFYANGLSVIVIDNLQIFNCQFAVEKFKTKKQIDKEKFAKFMNRVCK